MNNLDEGTHPFHFHGHKVTLHLTLLIKVLDYG